VFTGDAKPDSATRNLVKRHVMRDIAKARRNDSTYGKRNQLQLPAFLAPTETLGDGGQADNPMIVDDGKERPCQEFTN
jgi:hypothetical protein